MLRVGITGGIGSGKSTVAALFAALGVTVIDADILARELSAPGTEGYDAIVAHFGAEILSPARVIDRQRLRERVFADVEARKALEAILHPRIRARMHELARAARPPYCILVIPLLIETGQRDLVDRILVVDVPEDIQIARVMARSGLTRLQVQAIIAAQATRAARLAAAGDIIVNANDAAALEPEVARLHALYLTLSEKSNSDTPH